MTEGLVRAGTPAPMTEEGAMNSWVRHCAGAAIGTVATLSVSGCATGPDPEVVRAQAAVQGARAEPAVAEYAPVALREAEQALLKVERGQWQGLDDAEIDHLANLAVKKAAIAQAQSIIVEEILPASILPASFSSVTTEPPD